MSSCCFDRVLNQSSKDAATTQPLNSQLAGDVRNGARRGYGETDRAVMSVLVVVTNVELHRALDEPVFMGTRSVRTGLRTDGHSGRQRCSPLWRKEVRLWLP